jgi:hypothetical protein
MRRLRLQVTVGMSARHQFAAAIALAAGAFAPSRAFADSAIDPAVKPYFVLGGWVAALLFLGIGFFLLSRALQHRRMAAAAVQWPTTEGTVITAKVVKHTSKSDDEFDSYTPKVRYAYAVNGAHYVSDLVRIGLADIGYIREQQARDHLARYPVGATVAVRYDPQEPELAVLEIGQVGAARYLLAGGLLAAVGIAAVVFAIWSATLPVR